MIDAASLATIALMAAGTYLTRIIGYLVLRNRRLGPRIRYVLESVPGCVLISVIAPSFVAEKPADLVALAVTLLAATRFSILPTVLVGILSTAVLRYIFPGA